jgi:Ring finger domain
MSDSTRILVFIFVPLAFILSCVTQCVLGSRVSRFWLMANAPVTEIEDETELATSKKKQKRVTTAEEVENLPKILYVDNDVVTTVSLSSSKLTDIEMASDLIKRADEANADVALKVNGTDCELVAETVVDTSTTGLKPENVNVNNPPAFLNVADECCICLEKFQHNESLTSLPRCQHIFHPTCVGSWILQRKKNVCPFCKTDIFVDEITSSTSDEQDLLSTIIP